MFQELTDQQLAALEHQLGLANLAIWEARRNVGGLGYAAMLRETSLLVREVGGELAKREWRAALNVSGGGP